MSERTKYIINEIGTAALMVGSIVFLLLLVSP